MTATNIFGGHIKIVHTDHADDSGFFDDGDDFVAEGRNDVFDGLGCNNAGENSGIFKTESEAGFALAFVDGENAAADDFRSVGGRIETKSKHGSNELRKITNSKNDEKHNEKLQSHWSTANNSSINSTNEFRNDEPF